MAQWVKAPDCSSEGLEFKSQQPHGGSQPPAMRSDAFFWCLKTATVYLCITINKHLKKINLRKKKLATVSRGKITKQDHEGKIKRNIEKKSEVTYVICSK